MKVSPTMRRDTCYSQGFKVASEVPGFRKGWRFWPLRVVSSLCHLKPLQTRRSTCTNKRRAQRNVDGKSCRFLKDSYADTIAFELHS